jgi:hypothetical protein
MFCFYIKEFCPRFIENMFLVKIRPLTKKCPETFRLKQKFTKSTPGGAELGGVQDGGHAVGGLVDEDLVHVHHLGGPLHHLFADDLEKLTLGPANEHWSTLM